MRLRISLKRARYPAILGAFTAAVLGFFTFTAIFLSRTVDRALEAPDETTFASQALIIDLGALTTVTQKLGITMPLPPGD